jgi:hypothetical protein
MLPRTHVPLFEDVADVLAARGAPGDRQDAGGERFLS